MLLFLAALGALVAPWPEPVSGSTYARDGSRPEFSMLVCSNLLCLCPLTMTQMRELFVQ